MIASSLAYSPWKHDIVWMMTTRRVISAPLLQSTPSLPSALCDGASFRALATQKLDQPWTQNADSRARAPDGKPQPDKDASHQRQTSTFRSDWDLGQTSPSGDGSDPVRLPPLRPAAVLVPIIMRDELSVLLTRRPQHMKDHAGQIAFPGGKIEPFDTGPVAAALREAHEEVGLAPEFIEPIGFLDSYHLSTGYQISPLVALIHPGFTLRLDPGEVVDAFEVPLRFLMDRDNFQRHSMEWHGKKRLFHAVTYQDYTIWGATAGMILNLFERLSAR